MSNSEYMSVRNIIGEDITTATQSPILARKPSYRPGFWVYRLTYLGMSLNREISTLDVGTDGVMEWVVREMIHQIKKEFMDLDKLVRL